MPITLLEVDHACLIADDRKRMELARIYRDAPQERLPAAVDDFVRRHLERGGVFCCGQFDDRLLAAVSVKREADVWWLAHFCVRRNMRRRGVGSRLLALVAETAWRRGDVLRVETSHLRMEDQLLLARLGYRLETSGAYFELNPLGAGGKQ